MRAKSCRDISKRDFPLHPLKIPPKPECSKKRPLSRNEEPTTSRRKFCRESSEGDGDTKKNNLKLEELITPEENMKGILQNPNVMETLSLKSANMKQQYPQRVPTPPQLGSDEVDEANEIEYRFESARRQSFENWPASYIDPESLAAAGFYYTKQIDRVRCFECGLEICRWEEGDIPMVEHQRWGGRCRFIRKMACGNVPIGVDPNSVPVPRPRSRDVCGPYRLGYRLAAEVDSQPPSSTSPQRRAQETQETPPELQNVAKLGCLGISFPKRPDFPEYASYEARLLTFRDWPPSMAQTKEQLADAGFFYTGTGDHTTCYHCGGGLKLWEPQDDPWVQHAKWFSKCFYILLVKGQEFINSVSGKHITPPTEEETMQMNLPSCIKKVEQPSAVKTKENLESENAPGPSNETSNTKGDTSSVASSTKGTGDDVSTENTTTEKKSVDDARACKICYNEELGVVFLPCGHILACVKCAPGLTTCAVCRGPVTMWVRAFFS